MTFAEKNQTIIREYFRNHIFLLLMKVISHNKKCVSATDNIAFYKIIQVPPVEKSVRVNVRSTSKMSTELFSPFIAEHCGNPIMM